MLLDLYAYKDNYSGIRNLLFNKKVKETLFELK